MYGMICHDFILHHSKEAPEFGLLYLLVERKPVLYMACISPFLVHKQLI